MNLSFFSMIDYEKEMRCHTKCCQNKIYQISMHSILNHCFYTYNIKDLSYDKSLPISEIHLQQSNS